MAATPRVLLLSEKAYRKLLWVYPKAHRLEYGELMAQLFRDQCRDAFHRNGARGVLKLWLRVLADTGSSCLVERTAEIERNSAMKYSSAAKNPTVYMVAGLVLGLISFAPFIRQSSGLFQAMLIGSSLAIVAKAIVELFLPAREWLNVVLRTVALMVVFALYMPAWAKLNLTGTIPPAAHDFFRVFIMAGLFANPLVALVKMLQQLISRQRVAE